MSQSANDIRQDFIDFFADKHRHQFVPSSSVVPHDDPTLLFTNAGMNQFKDVFLGRGTRPYTRAVNSQKCIRAGGKHNDLEDVGTDTYHHTFFEMLGNWSFGDYFKAEAIQWAWTLLTEVWQLNPDRLYVTVFAGDDNDGLSPDKEAEELWCDLTNVNPKHITRWDRKDNFWEMGETGPCGPCSEIHYDSTSDGSGGPLVNMDDPMVIEIWNLVFIEFNRGQDGKLVKLPQQHVDTGMGLERIVRVLQGVDSNYDTDLWTPLFAAICDTTGARPYAGSVADPLDIAYRIIADHIRCLTVALSDGARCGNEGRDYVLRRILRRAARHARQTMGVDCPLLCQLVPTVVESLSAAFPDLKKSAPKVSQLIEDEEVSFLRTLDRGLALFDHAAAGSTKGVSAKSAFELHDTYGFPIDLTEVMAKERGLPVDRDGYEQLMDEARKRSRKTGDAAQDLGLTPDAIADLESKKTKPTNDVAKFEGHDIDTAIEAIWNGASFIKELLPGEHGCLVTTETNHYAEQGGQTGDSGTVEAMIMGDDSSAAGVAAFVVEDTIRSGPYVLHVGRCTERPLRPEQPCKLIIEEARRQKIMANHTCTHLLNLALRKVLGEEADQRGSLVADDRLRFDVACGSAMTPDQLAACESQVIANIEQNLGVHTQEMPLEKARSINGLRAVFGERYPERVRVVSIGPNFDDVFADPSASDLASFSFELCGGTHVSSTSDIGTCVIVQEQALAAGIRRITALTGESARQVQATGEAMLAQLKDMTNLTDDAFLQALSLLSQQRSETTLGVIHKHEIDGQLELLRKRAKEAKRQANTASTDDVLAQARELADKSDGQVVIEQIAGASKDTLLPALDVLRAKCPDSAIMLLSPDTDEGRVAIAAAVPKPLITSGLKAGDWVRAAAQACGGGGGGRPDMAQAGGKDPSLIDEAINTANDFAKEALS